MSGGGAQQARGGPRGRKFDAAVVGADEGRTLPLLQYIRARAVCLRCIMADFLTELGNNSHKFAERVAKVLGRPDTSDFKVIVTDYPDDKITAIKRDNRYYTVALMMVTNVTDDQGTDLTEAAEQGQPSMLETIEMKKLTGGLGRRSPMALWYDNWDAGQLKTQITKATKGLEGIERAQAIAYEQHVGSKYHNIIKLRVIPPFKKTEDGLVGVVLDSWFYYTLDSVKKAVKGFAPDATNLLFQAMKDYVYDDVGAHFMTLLDGWTGYNKTTKSYETSKELMAAARAFAEASGPEEVPTPFKLYESKFFQSVEGRSASGAKRAIAKHGYYGHFGFMRFSDLALIDEAFKELPIVQKAFLLAIYGNANNPLADRVFIGIRPIKVQIKGGPELPKVSVESTPEKIVGKSMPSYPRGMRFDLGDAIVDAAWFYDLIPRRPGSIINLVGGGPLIVVPVEKPRYEGPGQEVEAGPKPARGQKTKRDDRGFSARKKSLNAAFTDLSM